MKLLLVARHFPPLISGGARRWRLLTQALMRQGVEVRVIAPVLPEDLSGVVASHPAAAPAGAPSARPDSAGALGGARDWVRANLLLPDPDVRWALRAIAAAKGLGAFRPNWVVSTSPPESAHIAGLRLARRYDCRWLADLRDHWLAEPLMRQRRGVVRRWAETAIARRILRRADLITVTQQTILREIADYAPDTPIHVLPQAGPTGAPPRSSSPREPDEIRIVHTGSFTLSHDARDIAPTLALFAQAYDIDARFRLDLIGRLTAEEERRALDTPGVRVRGVMSLEEAWAAQAGADILLLAAAEDTAAVPGKLAEYKAAGRPIVCLGGGAWRADLPGAREDPVLLLASLRDPAARDRLAMAQADGACSPDEAAERLLALLQRVQK